MALDYTGMKEQAARLNDLSQEEFRTLEQRARRVAARQGLNLGKSRRRDPMAPDFGRFHIFDENNFVVAGATPWHYSMTLDEVIEFLLQD